MITMMDEIFDRQYQAGRADLNSGIDRALATIGREIGKSFKVLHDIEWDAPWARKAVARSKDVKCG